MTAIEQNSDTRIGTADSTAFQFREWRGYVVAGGESAEWTPAVYGLEKGNLPFVPVSRKWVYIFRDMEGVLTWEQELYLDSNGRIHPVDLENGRYLEPADRPQPRKAGLTVFTLPRCINSRPVRYYAYASRVRLCLDVVQQFLGNGNVRNLLPAVDIDVIAYAPGDAEKCHPNRLFYDDFQKCHIFGVVDPLTVLLYLSGQYLDALDARSTYSLVFAENSHLDEVRARYSALVVAQLLVYSMEADPEKEKDLASFFKDGSGQQARAFVKAHERKTRQLNLEVDLRAAEIANWLAGGLMALAEVAHAFDEENDMAAFLQPWADAVDRLNESGPGKTFLTGLLLHKGHFVHKYALPQTTPDTMVFQVYRKAQVSIVKIWAAFSAPYLWKYGKPAEYFEMCERLLLVEIFFEDPSNGVTARYWVEASVQERKIRQHKTIKVPDFSQPFWQKLIVDGSKASIITDRILGAVEAVNLGIVLMSMPKDADAKHKMAAVGASADVGSALGAIFGMAAKKSVVCLGLVSAMMDIFTGAWDTAVSIDRHDYRGAAGNALATFGAGIVAGGLFASLVGGVALTAVAGPLAIGALMIGIGVAITAFLSHKDLEVFVNHCCFGANYGSGGVTDWSGGYPMRSWKSSPELQIDALVQILCRFELERGIGADPMVTIRPGLIYPESRFHLHFETNYIGNAAYTHAPRVYVDIPKNQLVQTGGDETDLTAVRVDWPEKPSIRVWPLFTGSNLPPEDLDCRSSVVSVFLDWDGKGKTFIPSKENPVHCTLI